MIKINELTEYLNELIEIDRHPDHSPNGLQIYGRDEVKRIAVGVSACQELFEQAVSYNADTILVHHGLFWDKQNLCLVGVRRKRVAILLEHNINLLGYHLPLDFHPEYGNNIQLARLLGITFKTAEPPIYTGHFSKPQALEQLSSHLTSKLNHRPLIISAGSNPIKNIAWCTGGAADYLELAAHHNNVDAYLTGEINERSVYLARELGVHLIAAGHYATERWGVKALAAHLEQKFTLECQFIELANPI